MKKLLLPACILCMFILGILIVKAGDNKKNTPPPAPIKDVKAEKRKADSLTYVNFTVDTNDYTYQSTPNEVLLNNGMKISIVKLTRFPIPRGVAVVIPDDISQRFAYELAEVEIKATNTTSSEIKLGASATDALFVSLKFYATETGSKGFVSQYPLSFGSIYNMMEPAQPEKLTPVFKETQAMISDTYKPGQTKTSKGIIVCLAKAAKHIDKIVINNQEFGTNKSYACPANL
jgi:hypothetical protein